MGTEVNLTLDATRVRALRLDDRGRVTIPKELREELEASEGDKIELAVIDRSELTATEGKADR